MEYVKQKKFIIRFFYTLILLAIVYFAIKYVLALVTPFIIAYIISYFLRRPINAVSNKLKISSKTSAFFVVFAFYFAIFSAILAIGLKFFISLPDVISQFPLWYKAYISPIITNDLKWVENSNVEYRDIFIQFSKSIDDVVKNISTEVVNLASIFASSIPAMFIKILITVISTFFISTDYNRISGFIFNQFSDKGKELVICIKDYVVGTLFVCFRSYLLIMTITFVELSIGLTIIGVSNSILIAASIAIFDILPVLGTGGIMIPWVLITFLQGNYPVAVSLLGLYIIVTIVRNILEPKIIGKQIGLSPLVTLMSMFVGVQIFGVIGLFGFPITLSLILYLNEKNLIPLFKKNKENVKTQE